MTISIDNKTWQRNPAQVSGGRFYSDVDKVPASGTAHGSTVTASGTGFGTKSTVKPLVYDNFESGTVGNVIAGNAPVEREIGASWVWDDYTSATERPKYGSDNPRGVSTKVAKMHFESSGNYNCSLEIFKDILNSGDEVYFSFWMRYNRTSAQYSRNFKPWVIYGNDSGIFPEAYVGWGNPDYGDGGLRNSAQDAGGADGTIWGGPDASVIGGEWRRFEMRLKQSTPSVSDGAWQVWSHDPDNAATVALIMNDITYMTRSSSNYWRQFHFGSYHDTLRAEGQPHDVVADVLMDEIYFDTTQARIEVCDNATWASRTRSEIQIPLSWSDTSVQFRANKGGFATASTGYIFVIDSTGTAHAAGTLTWS